MTRWKAAALHLTISILVILSVLGLVIWLWYPPALLPMSGLDRLIGIIAAVDVIAGPLLTLLVFKTGKPGLRVDLSVIALLQLALLSYGLITLAQVRPVFLVGLVDRLHLITANQIDESDLARARAPFNTLSWTGPLLVGARLPTDADERDAATWHALAGGGTHRIPRHYIPYQKLRADLASTAASLESLIARSDAQVAASLRKYTQADPSIRYLPIDGARGDAVMLLDNAGLPERPVSVDPWPDGVPAAQKGQ